MIAEVFSGAVVGIDGFGVTVEIDIATGLPSFTIVGLPNAAVRESRERVTSAIRNNGYKFPSKKITVNLAPADIRKEGAAFDLPIALGILLADGQIKLVLSGSTVILGELALDGKLKPVRGVLSVVCFARDLGYRRVMVPDANAPEASVVEGISILQCRDLGEAVTLLGGAEPRTVMRPRRTGTRDSFHLDYSQVIGQPTAKRALQVAAAGGHHVLMVGPPGSGKTMLSKRLQTILPPLDKEEVLENAKIMSVTDGLDVAGISYLRPFRAPHHSASDAGLIGGGRNANPGEITRAHNGILFLDELTEFRRNVLETLRQPLEEGRIIISRANVRCAYPARFQLIAAMNPCPCGYYGSSSHVCRCTPLMVRRYLSKISGPLLDRISIHIPVRMIDAARFEEAGHLNGPGSSEIRAEVMKTVEIQRNRYMDKPGIRRNSDLPESLFEPMCPMNEGTKKLLAEAQRSLLFSARTRRNIIQVARTIADLDDSTEIMERHLGEAIQYRVPRSLLD